MGPRVKDIEALVSAAQAGDTEAYGEIIRRFQDMAYGCAYSVLGDFHLAQDAAQEAFIEAYRHLATLADASAFPGWFRRIVQYRCSRIARSKRHLTVPIEDAAAVSAGAVSPDRSAEDREMKEKVLDAVRSLPRAQREVTTLFYINGYSHNDIAEFLVVPVGTVKSRLHASRKQLAERMTKMVKNTFEEHKLPDDFTGKVAAETKDAWTHYSAEAWDQERGVFLDMEKHKFWTYCAERYGSPILEVACANGRWAIPLALRYPDYEVVGIDINPDFIGHAQRQTDQKRAEGHELNARFHVRDMVDFDLARTFSLAIMTSYTWSVLIRHSDQIAFLQCLREHLKPGGAFAFNVFMPQHRQADIVRQEDGTYEWPSKTVYSTQDSLYDPVTQIERPKVATPDRLPIRHTYLSEFLLLFRLTGFKLVEIYGMDNDMRPFTGRFDDDYVIVAERI